MKDFQSIYKNLAPRLKSIAAKFASIYSNCRPIISKEDLYQEMGLWLWQKYQSGIPENINDVYLIQGCKFHIQNHIRKTKNKYVKISLDQPVTPQGQTLKEFIPDRKDKDLSTIEKNVLADRIRNEDFSEKEKEVFTLMSKDYTTRQIGIKMKISHVMVIKHKRNIISKLTKKPVTKSG